MQVNWNLVQAKANADGEFRHSARLLDTDLEIGIGDSRFNVNLAGGEIQSITQGGGASPPAIVISAPENDWLEMLAAIPRPFYQDLFPAILHHGFQLEGDNLLYCAYYPAIRRFIEITREIYNNG